jgi:hypothetical protein
MTSEDIKALDKQSSLLHEQEFDRANNQPTLINARQSKSLQLLVWWVQDRKSCNAGYKRFNLDARNHAIEVISVPTDSETATLMLTKFQSGKWPNWSKSVKNYLSGLQSIQMITIDYSIRQLLDPNNPFLMCDPGQQVKYNARLTGLLFNQDNKRVFRILKDLTLGTLAWEFIKHLDNAQDGHACWNTLKHYKGHVHHETILQLAHNPANNIKYRRKS